MKMKHLVSAVAAALLLGAATPFVNSVQNVPITVSAATKGTYNGMEYELYDDHVMIVGYDNSAAEIEIPAEIEGVPVTLINQNSFENASNLQKVTIPDTVIRIGYNAFTGCSMLSEITIPDSVVSIGDTCFANCASLRNIKLPSNLTYLGKECFSNCALLEELEFPGTLKEIPYHVAFNCNNLQNVVIQHGPTKIGEKSFGNCTALKTVFIPISVIEFHTVSWASFQGCNIETVYYAGSSLQWNAIAYANFTFSDTTKIVYDQKNPPRLTGGDVNGDGSINAADATVILQYAAFLGAGGMGTLQEFLASQTA